jgi:protein-L-isoaspartate(D-aspartate) O-methyltransferase
MIDEQLVPRGIDDSRVLDAMASVPREEFVPASLRASAYEDTPLPIGCGQTISQPFTVAWMCQALELRGDEKVLEVGTGSGYGAAVLSRLAREVHTVECIPGLAGAARERLRRLGYANVEVHTGNGTLGLPDQAPFDAIVVTAGAKDLPRGYVDQLAKGGRLVIPLGATRESQLLYRIDRRNGELEVKDLGCFAFVPLVGRFGWQPPDAQRRSPW